MADSVRRVLGICGSLQASSSNLRLLGETARLAPQELVVEIDDQLRHLPLFNPDLENEVPAEVESWRKALASCDGVLIACPEYGHSLPGALKNGIDWVIGSGELYQKVVAITAAVKTAERGLRGLAALRQTLMAVDAKVIWDTPTVSAGGAGAGVKSLLERLQIELGSPRTQ